MAASPARRSSSANLGTCARRATRSSSGGRAHSHWRNWRSGASAGTSRSGAGGGGVGSPSGRSDRSTGQVQSSPRSRYRAARSSAPRASRAPRHAGSTGASVDRATRTRSRSWGPSAACGHGIASTTSSSSLCRGSTGAEREGAGERQVVERPQPELAIPGRQQHRRVERLRRRRPRRSGRRSDNASSRQR